MSGKTRLVGFLWFCFLLGAAGLAAAGGLVYRNIQESTLRNELSARYGAPILALCDSPQPKASDAKFSSTSNKYLVIDRTNGLIHTAFQNALKASLSATSKADITAVICVRPVRDLVEPCGYTSKTSSTRYTVNRWQN